VPSHLAGKIRSIDYHVITVARMYVCMYACSMYVIDAYVTCDICDYVSILLTFSVKCDGTKITSVEFSMAFPIPCFELTFFVTDLLSLISFFRTLYNKKNSE